jgi:hypothetical protein
VILDWCASRSASTATGLVQRLLQASEGITGPVTRLLSLAAVEAIRSSGECIDEAGIDLAATRLERDFT